MKRVRTRAERKEEKRLVVVHGLEPVAVRREQHHSHWMFRYGLPLPLLGRAFEFLNWFETVRFLVATGRMGQGVLRTAYRSQLVVNFGPRERWLLIRETLAPLLQPLTGNIRVLRLHNTALPRDLAAWQALVHSPELTDVVLDGISQPHDRVVRVSKYINALQNKPQLQVFQWA